MLPFTAKHLTRSTSIHLAASPDRVFPLFEPLAERAWAAEWEPEILYPPSGATEEGTVFITRHHTAVPTIWTVVQFAPQQFQIRYVRVAPDSHVAHIAIACTESESGMTQATITYTFTALTEHGNAYIETFTEDHYRHWIQSWETAINHYLQHGTPPRHQAT